jgi:hypothetical protein
MKLWFVWVKSGVNASISEIMHREELHWLTCRGSVPQWLADLPSAVTYFSKRESTISSIMKRLPSHLMRITTLFLHCSLLMYTTTCLVELAKDANFLIEENLQTYFPGLLVGLSRELGWTTERCFDGYRVRRSILLHVEFCICGNSKLPLWPRIVFTQHWSLREATA